MKRWHRNKMMEISLNRDSVCMGDDCENRQIKMTIDENTKISNFLLLLSDYVPHMKNIIWAINSNNGILGYIITDDSSRASFDMCEKNSTIKESDIQKVMCIYYYPSKFTYIDGNSGKQINKYSECATFLEKVKIDTSFIQPELSIR